MKSTGKGAPQRGDKKRYVREALEALGLDATKGQAAQWIEKKYGTSVGDPTFYDVRREMQQGAPAPPEAARRTEPEDGGAREALGASGEPTPIRAAAPPARAEGVVEMVTKAKDLIEQLGKEEAKRLIDAL